MNPVRWLTAIRKYFSSSIRNRIITPYAVLTLLFAAFGVFVVTRLVVVSLEDRLKNQLINAGRVVSEEVVNREELRLEIERFVANTEDVPDTIVSRDVSQLNQLVSPFMANEKDVDSIIVVDTQGNELLRLQRSSPDPNAVVETTLESGVSYINWPAVSRVLANPDGSKEIQLGQDSTTNELIIYTVGPVRTDDGVVGAVLVGTYLTRELGALRSLALADITLFDNRSQVIDTTFVIGEDEQYDNVFSVFSPARYQEVLTNEDVTLLDEITVQEDNYRMAYAPFVLRGTIHGVYSVALPTNFITSSDTDNRNTLILLFSLGVVAVFGVGYMISNRIIQPILQLVNTSQLIAKGDLSKRTGLQLEDEIGILAATFDNMTSELQKKTNELEEEASKLNAILSSIADGVMVQDMAGNIIRMNPAARQILEAVGGDLQQLQQHLMDKELQINVNDLDIPLLNELTGLQFHQAQRFEVGRRVVSAISAPVLGSDDEQLGLVVVLRDISREVESERLKDDFITSMSHELRTPLTAIKGYNDLLRMTAQAQLNERQVGFIEYIDQNVGDLLNLIQGVLDLSQIDAQTLGIDREPLDFTDLVAKEASNWADKMDMKELAFETQLPSEPIWVEGDWGRLTRVVYHLLKNANDYTMPEGQVTLAMSQDETSVKIMVTDTGVGIAKEDQKFLFTRFYRAVHEDHGEEIHEVSGAGLGLYMSKAIIEAHGGQMGVESDLHQGSVFYFTVPTIDDPFDEVEEEDPVDYFEPSQIEQSEL